MSFAVDDFVAHESAALEQVWGRIERLVPAALAAVRDGSALDRPDVVDQLKAVLALHWARSSASKAVNTRLRDQVVVESMSRYSKSPGLLDAVFLDKTGLYPAGRKAREIANQLLHESGAAKFDESWFHSVQRHYMRARTEFKGMGLKLGHAPKGKDFVIGDVPVITAGRYGLAQHQGVALMDADSILMPIGPQTVLSIAPELCEEELTVADVDEINRLQKAAFIRWLAWQPGGPEDRVFNSNRVEWSAETRRFELEALLAAINRAV